MPGDQHLVRPTTAHGPAPPLDFEALYRSSRDDVYAYVATLLRDRSAAEDVTAAAFERAYRRQRTFDAGRGIARAWLFGIARNAALDELRRRKRRPRWPTSPPTEAAGARGHGRGRGRRPPRAALGTLQPRERELIALKFHAGLDNAEVAAVLGVTVSNAGTQLHRAMTKLREASNA